MELGRMVQVLQTGSRPGDATADRFARQHRLTGDVAGSPAGRTETTVPQVSASAGTSSATSWCSLAIA